MARGSLGAKLINGMVKAISQSHKEDQKNRLMAARDAEAQSKKLRQLRAREEIKNERLIEKEASEHERYLSEKQKRIEKENERRIKEEERAQIQSERDAKRNAELLQKENIRRAIAKSDEELSQGNAFFRVRCNERRNLRLDYIRRLLK